MHYLWIFPKSFHCNTLKEPMKILWPATRPVSEQAHHGENQSPYHLFTSEDLTKYFWNSDSAQSLPVPHHALALPLLCSGCARRHSLLHLGFPMTSGCTITVSDLPPLLYQCSLEHNIPWDNPWPTTTITNKVSYHCLATREERKKKRNLREHLSSLL